MMEVLASGIHFEKSTHIKQKRVDRTKVEYSLTFDGFTCILKQVNGIYGVSKKALY